MNLYDKKENRYILIILITPLSVVTVIATIVIIIVIVFATVNFIYICGNI